MEKTATKELIASYQEKLNEANKELLKLKQAEESERKELELLKLEYSELAEMASKVVKEKDECINRYREVIYRERMHTFDLIEASRVKAANTGGRKGRYATDILEQLANNIATEFDGRCWKNGLMLKGGKNGESRNTGKSEGNR